ncbi:hypothetical protein CWB95_18195 [Pseudoalteromonas piscicida]|nr:hypothetical protein CWB95_18195 [Pseudoalteromonas piscicida]
MSYRYLFVIHLRIAQRLPNAGIAESFKPPTFFDSQNFHFRVLKEEVDELDFEAVMYSLKRLQGLFDPDS